MLDNGGAVRKCSLCLWYFLLLKQTAWDRGDGEAAGVFI
jgi:hypothetical protein